MARQPNKSSADFSVFCVRVYEASATYMDIDEYLDYYSELLRVLWWNTDLDLPLAVAEEKGKNPSGVVHGVFHA